MRMSDRSQSRTIDHTAVFGPRVLPMTVLLFAGIVGVGFPVAAQTHPPVRAERLTAPIVIDGSLDDAGWKGTEPIDITLEVDPRENLPATQRTTAWLAYDDRMFYVAFLCHDTDMGRLRAQLTERDNAFNDDGVLFFLDTFGDNQRAYEFFVNPLNVQG